MRLLSLVLMAVVLNGCVNLPIDVAYRTPDLGFSRFPPHVNGLTVAPFTDDRGEPRTWIATVRSGVGTPLKILHAGDSVSAVVKRAFEEAIRRRRGDTSPARFAISGSIKRLDGMQYIRRDGHAEIEIAVTDLKSGKEVFRRRYRGELTEGQLTDPAGVFGSVQRLESTVSKALSRVIDAALDDPAFHRALM